MSSNPETEIELIYNMNFIICYTEVICRKILNFIFILN